MGFDVLKVEKMATQNLAGYLAHKADKLVSEKAEKEAKRLQEQVRKKFHKDRRKLVRKAVVDIFPDLKVAHGPFKGMRYPEAESVGSSLFPKLLGSYEAELHGLVESLCEKGYSEIIDVGCAEGYYAIGMAIRLPEARVFAFDVEERAIVQCRKMAELNGVEDRVTFGAFCDPEMLASIPVRNNALVISDCEGYERQLFTPDVKSILQSYDLLIETHDCFDIDISTYLENLFSDTHNISSILSIDDIQKAKKYEYAELNGFDLKERHMLFSEFRASIMEWLFIESRS